MACDARAPARRPASADFYHVVRRAVIVGHAGGGDEESPLTADADIAGRTAIQAAGIHRAGGGEDLSGQMSGQISHDLTLSN